MTPQSRCDDCGHLWSDSELVEPRHLSQRLDPGGVVPSGECPDCGALCYPLDPGALFVYDLPERPPRSRELEAEQRNARVLGKAVHPGALRRLHELVPEAKVYVRHHVLTALAGDVRAGVAAEVRPTTRVMIDTGREGERRVAVGSARCAAGDKYDRKLGIQLAFRRALELVREDAKQRGQAGACRGGYTP